MREAVRDPSRGKHRRHRTAGTFNFFLMGDSHQQRQTLARDAATLLLVAREAQPRHDLLYRQLDQQGRGPQRSGLPRQESAHHCGGAWQQRRGGSHGSGKCGPEPPGPRREVRDRRGGSHRRGLRHASRHAPRSERGSAEPPGRERHDPAALGGAQGAGGPHPAVHDRPGR
jgi:hypothetical protein